MLEKIIAAFIAVASILSGSSCSAPNNSAEWDLPDETREIDGRTYKLTFYDDFDGDSLDLTKWRLCPEWKRGDIGGKWSDSMTKLDGSGNLSISAGLDEKGTPISGAIRTSETFYQARGYYEIRCKLQNAPGFWGAFWLMCEGEKKIGNGAVDGAEIDIFESHSVSGDEVNHAIHWDGYGEHHRSIAKPTTGKNLYDGEYHTFALLWDENGYFFYVDGEMTCRFDKDTPNYPGSSEEPSYLKITAEFGSWAGSYDAEKLPDGLTVDYVKVYALS